MLIDLQLKYLETKFKKNCIYHQKQSQTFCYKLNCTKSPYICNYCIKEGVHIHKDAMGNLNQFLRQIIVEIQDYENFYKNAGEGDEFVLNASVKQQTDILKSIQKFQYEILEIINQSKQRIKRKIQVNMDRLKKTPNSKIKFYKNPNLLINKLTSESSIDFIIKLKKSLADRRQDPNTDTQKTTYKNQLNILKNNIKQLIQSNFQDLKAYSSNINETKNSRLRSASRLQIIEKKIYQLPVLPNKIYNFNDRMIVCGQKTFLFNLQQKTAIPIEPNLALCASNKQKMKGQFIGISYPNTLFYYSENNNKKSIKIKSDCTAIAALCTRDENYGIIGYQQGQIQSYCINSQICTSKIKKHNNKILNLSIIQYDNLIIASSRDGKVSLYKYKYQDNVIKIQFITYLIGGMQQLLGHQIYKKQIILYNLAGNIKIIDYSLNQVVLQSNFTKEKPIVDMLIVPIPKGYFLLILNKNDKQLKVWNIDRQRSTYKIQNTAFNIKNNDVGKNAMFIWNDNLWILKQALSEIHVATIQFP